MSERVHLQFIQKRKGEDHHAAHQLQGGDGFFQHRKGDHHGHRGINVAENGGFLAGDVSQR